MAREHCIYTLAFLFLQFVSFYLIGTRGQCPKGFILNSEGSFCTGKLKYKYNILASNLLN